MKPTENKTSLPPTPPPPKENTRRVCVRVFYTRSDPGCACYNGYPSTVGMLIEVFTMRLFIFALIQWRRDSLTLWAG